jgi:hypothetical protein
VTQDFFLWFTASGLGAITIERRLWPTSLGYLIALFAALARPDLVLLVMSASHAVLTVNAVVIWLPTRSASLLRFGPIFDTELWHAPKFFRVVRDEGQPVGHRGRSDHAIVSSNHDPSTIEVRADLGVSVRTGSVEIQHGPGGSEMPPRCK